MVDPIIPQTQVVGLIVGAVVVIGLAHHFLSSKSENEAKPSRGWMGALFGSQPVPSRSSVVIVGAGYGGCTVAQELDKKGFNVVLIEKLDFTYHSMGALRAVVDASFAPRVLVPNSSLLKKEVVMQGEVMEVLENAVVLTSGESVSFDALLIATGAIGSFPNKPPPGVLSSQEMLTLFQNTSTALKTANTIAIIGGGAVGVELAGEIKFVYPTGKLIHVFESHSALLDNLVVPLSSQMKQRTLELVQSSGVEVHLGKRVDLAELNKAIEAQNRDTGVNVPVLDRTQGGEPYLLRTDSGEEISADLVFVCVGNAKTAGKSPLYESSWWKAHASPSNPTRLSVNKHLQVEGTGGNIFVLGDAAALEENQMAYFASKLHPPILLKNIYSVLSAMSDNLPTPPLAVYNPQTSPALLLPYGPRAGLTQFGSHIMGSWFTSMMKGADLFTTPLWKARGLTPPSTRAL